MWRGVRPFYKWLKDNDGKTQWTNDQMSFSRKKLYPLLRIFLKLTPLDFQSNLPYFFLHWPPWKTNVFSSSFGVPPGIQTTFTLPPWNFPLISSTGVLQFFSGKAQYTWRKIIMVKPNEHYDQGALVFRQDRSQRIVTNYFAFHIFMNAYPGKPLRVQWTVNNEGPDILAKHIQRSLTGRGRGIELGTFQSF